MQQLLLAHGPRFVEQVTTQYFSTCKFCETTKINKIPMAICYYPGKWGETIIELLVSSMQSCFAFFFPYLLSLTKCLYLD